MENAEVNKKKYYAKVFTEHKICNGINYAYKWICMHT